MLNDPILWNDWHPVASIYQLQETPILATRLLSDDDELDCTAWFVVATNRTQDSEQLRIDYTPRIGAIFAENRAMIESQRPELLPLDLQAELHLRSDRMAIGDRSWLRALGLRYGAV